METNIWNKKEYDGERTAFLEAEVIGFAVLE
jgi:hypothetical protein